MTYEELKEKIKISNELQAKIALAAVADFHSPKPFKSYCGNTCNIENCDGVHIDPKQGCQCGSWYPCQTMQLLERSLDWL
jgi:uncharacterized membrane protein